MRRPRNSSSHRTAALLLVAVGVLTAKAFRFPSSALPSSSSLQQHQQQWAPRIATTALEARKGGRKGSGGGGSSAGEGFGAPKQQQKAEEQQGVEEEGPVPGEGVTPAGSEAALKADVKAKMERLGASIEALAAQVVRVSSMLCGMSRAG